jgi:hypothetical protein
MLQLRIEQAGLLQQDAVVMNGHESFDGDVNQTDLIGYGILLTVFEEGLAVCMSELY